MPFQKVSFNVSPCSDLQRSTVMGRLTGAARRGGPAPKGPTPFALAYVAKRRAAREAADRAANA